MLHADSRSSLLLRALGGTLVVLLSGATLAACSSPGSHFLKPVEDYAGAPRDPLSSILFEPGADYAVWLPNDRFAVVVHGSSSCPQRVKHVETFDGYIETVVTLEKLGTEPCSEDTTPHTTVFDAPAAFLDIDSDVMIGLPGGKVALSHGGAH